MHLDGLSCIRISIHRYKYSQNASSQHCFVDMTWHVIKCMKKDITWLLSRAKESFVFVIITMLFVEAQLFQSATDGQVNHFFYVHIHKICIAKIIIITMMRDLNKRKSMDSCLMWISACRLLLGHWPSLSWLHLQYWLYLCTIWWGICSFDWSQWLSRDATTISFHDVHFLWKFWC